MTEPAGKPRGNTARVALGTLTAIPAGAKWDPETARKALGWYPAIGWLIGLLAAAVPFVAMALGWRGKSAAMVGVLILGAIVATSKAMHYDGLADTADGLLGGDSPERRLEIMDDSAVGAFGVTVVAFSIAAQSAALTGIVQTTAWYAIIVGCVVSRFCAAAALWTLPAARKGGLVAPLAGRPRVGTVALSMAWLVALVAIGFVVVGEDFSSVGFSGVPFSAWPPHQLRGFVWCTLGALAAGLTLPALLARPVKGLTGDIIGSTIVLTTTFTFAVAALLG
jgi:adenosylcobinamide-GDP ribazoletransferase